MAHAERCPVCEGGGWLPVCEVGADEPQQPHAKCHGCDGKGWVTVEGMDLSVATNRADNKTKDSWDEIVEAAKPFVDAIEKMS